MAENTNKESLDNAANTSARERLFEQMKLFSMIATEYSKKGVVKTTRTMLPMIEGYADSRVNADGQETGEIESGSARKLSDGEWTVLKAAGAKLAFETIELASLAYPAVEGIEPYRAEKNKETGQYPAPHLGQLLSVGLAVQQYMAVKQDDDCAKNEDVNSDELISLDNNANRRQPILLTAVSSDEYAYIQGPVEPVTIRRVAMNQRSLNQKSGAITGPQYYNQPASSSASQSMRQQQMTANTQLKASSPHVCSSCGGGQASFASSSNLARYDENGECASTSDISCETKWRLRDCFKVAVCELLTCIGEEFCEDGSFQTPLGKTASEVLKDCLGSAACSALQCVPNAICAPRPDDSCIPPPALECNFAVEERD
jgi:hypothetical protein